MFIVAFFIVSKCENIWEIDMESKPSKILGIYQNWLPRNWWNQPLFLGRFWAVASYVESRYIALGPEVTLLLPLVGCHKTGVFLNYELGECSVWIIGLFSVLWMILLQKLFGPISVLEQILSLLKMSSVTSWKMKYLGSDSVSVFWPVNLVSIILDSF